MKKKSILIYCLIALSFCIIAVYFPLTGIDITSVLKNVDSLSSIIQIEDANLLTLIFKTLFIKFDLLRIVMFGLIGSSVITLMGTIVDKKNKVLTFIAFFLFFLLDRIGLAESLSQIHGFTAYLIGTFGLLLFMQLLIKNTIPKIDYLGLFILGVMFSNMELPFAFTIFTLTLIYLYRREDKTEDHSVALILGEMLGMINAVFHMKVTSSAFISNLLHEFIPTICNANFIIILILSTLIMIEAIKIFNRGKRREATTAILGIGSFLFSSLLSTNDYLNYVTFVFYSLSSLYILLNVTSSEMFKMRIKTYYLFKLILIVMLSMFGTIDSGSTLFFFLIDIIIILEFYNYILPTEFLAPLWIGIVIVMSGVNIYTYKNARLKYDAMNFYIKNKLECTTENIVLPSKYETDFLVDYLPVGRIRTMEYIEYYGIDVYDKERTIEFNFRENAK